MSDETAVETNETPSTTTKKKAAVGPGGQGKTVKKAPVKKKAAAAKPVPKAATKPASEKAPVDQATKEIRWTPNKVALLKAFKAAGALSAQTAVPPSVIATKSKGALALNQVEHQLNPKFDLAMQKIIARVDLEEGRAYYLTPKGAKVNTEA